MQILILAVGRRPSGWVAAAEADYLARLKPYAKLTVQLVPPADANRLGVAAAQAAENAALLAKLPAGWPVWACHPAGESGSSTALAARLAGVRDSGGRLVILVGGSHGLAAETLARVSCALSFSALTFPHELFRVLLAEQLYRCFSYLAGRSYHK